MPCSTEDTSLRDFYIMTYDISEYYNIIRSCRSICQKSKLEVYSESKVAVFKNKIKKHLVQDREHPV